MEEGCIKVKETKDGEETNLKFQPGFLPAVGVSKTERGMSQEVSWEHQELGFAQQPHPAVVKVSSSTWAKSRQRESGMGRGEEPRIILCNFHPYENSFCFYFKKCSI